MRGVRLRSVWLQTHRWLGIVLGPLLVLIGLTGSLLVFDHAIDEFLNPELLLTDGTGTRRPLREVIAAAEAAYADGTQPAESVTAPRMERGVWTVWFVGGSDEQLQFTAVHVDPYTATVTGQRIWGQDLMSWIYRLHFQLVAGRAGGVVVGLLGLVLLASVLSGVVLWWPLWQNSWRAAFAVRRGKRFSYDLHKTVGITSAVVLAVVAATGVYMEFPEWVKPVVTTWSAETLPPENLQSTPAAEAVPLTPEQAIAIATERYPAARFCHLHPPKTDRDAYEVAVRQPHEVQRSYGRTQVFLDQYTGEVLAERRPQDYTAADVFLAWQFPLHNGEAFGLAGRWLIFTSGFTPLLLYVTGMVVWLRKTKRRSPPPAAPATTPTRTPAPHRARQHAEIANGR